MSTKNICAVDLLNEPTGNENLLVESGGGDYVG